MSLAFIKETTTNPDIACWTLADMETVSTGDGPRELPGAILGSVTMPSSATEREARTAFHRKRAADARLLSALDALT